jgi:hypothetical protein
LSVDVYGVGKRCSQSTPHHAQLLLSVAWRTQLGAFHRGSPDLYGDVEVTGTAQWLKNSWRIFSFTIHEVREQPVQGSIVEAMEALREAGGKAWDLIDDPRAYLEEIETE